MTTEEPLSSLKNRLKTFLSVNHSKNETFLASTPKTRCSYIQKKKREREKESNIIICSVLHCALLIAN